MVAVMLWLAALRGWLYGSSDLYVSLPQPATPPMVGTADPPAPRLPALVIVLAVCGNKRRGRALYQGRRTSRTSMIYMQEEKETFNQGSTGFDLSPCPAWV